MKILKTIIAYLYGMGKKKKEAKKPPKTMEELTKNFEQFMADKEINEDNGAAFEQALKKAVKKKDSQ